MRAWLYVGAASVLGLAFVAILTWHVLSPSSTLVVSNFGQIFAPTLAAVLCFRAARRRAHGHPRSWIALAVGVGGWAVGQSIWTFYEVALDSEVPFPSLADVGFLVFPLAAAYGLVNWLGTQDTVVARGRDLLDGVIIALSLLVLSWVMALDAATDESAADWTAAVLSMLYPVGDVILVTLALMALARGRSGERLVLTILALGIGFLAFADSAYVYLVSLGTYTSHDWATGGWVLGFLLIGAAAAVDISRSVRRLPAPPLETTAADSRAGLFRLVLPYIPFTAAGSVVVWHLLTSPHRDAVSLILGVSLVVLVLSRQFLAMAENQRLYVDLGTARDQLRYQALHDYLTGLPNRALFADRLDHALRRPGVDLALLFCDLDEFKSINDRFGHAAGDQLLREVAQRLVSCVRDGDTVARLGGDEFAILLENADMAQQVTDRINVAMLEPFVLNDNEVSVSMSLGVTNRKAGQVVGQRRADPTSTKAYFRQGVLDSPETVAHQMLREADLAMYAAKTSGKGIAVVAGEMPDHEMLGEPSSDRTSGGEIESGPKRT